MAMIDVEIEETELEGDHGPVTGILATCTECRHVTESFGTGERSITRCLVLMRDECPMGDRNFYVEA